MRSPFKQQIEHYTEEADRIESFGLKQLKD